MRSPSDLYLDTRVVCVNINGELGHAGAGAALSPSYPFNVDMDFKMLRSDWSAKFKLTNGWPTQVSRETSSFLFGVDEGSIRSVDIVCGSAFVWLFLNSVIAVGAWPFALGERCRGNVVHNMNTVARLK